MSAWASVAGASLATMALVFVGVMGLMALDRAVGARFAGATLASALRAPFQEAARALIKEVRLTEHPDRPLWLVAPLLLIALAVAALVVMPWGTWIAADLSVGVVYFTALFALAWAVVFMAGWGPNSKYPLIAGYRFVGMALAYEMPFAITIISVALPAESLQLGAIVATQQAGLWNLVLQPLALPIYLICVLALGFYGPFDLINSADLAGGARLEYSGALRWLWTFGQYTLLLAALAFAVPLFLGGHDGPWLPPWLWTLTKLSLLAAIVVWLRHRLVRVRLDRFMKYAWIFLIPLSLVNLFVTGLLILIWPQLAGGVS